MDNLRTIAWYETWFDSPYYALLYDYRNEAEARAFIDALLLYLKPKSGAAMLDLACGRGRHARYLAEHGFDVTGIDLSENNIRYARQFEHARLHFYKHDMRQIFRVNFFDYIFNFFTSFGYFDKETDNLKALKAVAKGLKHNGTFVIDFFNPDTVTESLPHETTETRGNVVFHIRKKMESPFVVKDIVVEEGEERYFFTERVRIIDLNTFMKYFTLSGLKIRDVFGDYRLAAFDANHSERMIIVGEKPS